MTDAAPVPHGPKTPTSRQNEVPDKPQTSSLSCSLCNKVYSRSDVLSRHLVQAHGKKAKRAGRPRKNGHLSVGIELKNGPQHSTRLVTRSSTQQGPRRPPQSRHVARYTTGGEGVGEQNGEESSATATGSTPIRIDWDMLSQDLVGLGDNGPLPFIQQQNHNYQQQQHQSGQQAGFDFGDSVQDLFFFSTSRDYDWTANHAPAAVASTASFDWGFTDVADTDMFEAIGAIPLPPPPPPDPPQEQEPEIVSEVSPRSISGSSASGTRRSPPDRDSEIVRALKAEEVDGQPNTGDLPNGSPEESAWPTLYYQPNTPVDPVDLPTATRPSTPTPRVPATAVSFCTLRGETATSGVSASSLMTETASVNAQARMSMHVLSAYAHRPVWPLPDLANFPSIPRLTACINCYLTHFAEWLPIVDSPRQSFRVDKAAPILLMAMAAVGAVYACGGLEKLAFPLDELVRRQIVYICEHDHRFVLEPCIMQASLLQSYFGQYSGSPRLFHHAEISRASLVAACRRMHLLHAEYSAAKELRRREPAAPRDAVRKAMRQDHRYSRLGWAIFLFDAQMFCFFGTPCHCALSDIQVSLPAVDIIPVPENGQDASVPPLRPTFSQMMTGLLENGQLLEEPSDMGFACLAYALYRLCLESASAPSFLQQGVSPKPQNTHPAQARLDQLSCHIIGTPAALTSLRVSCVALAHHAYLELTDVGLMSTIKIAAGRSGEQEQKAAQADVARRLQADPAGARSMFVHAAMLLCLLNRFTFDSRHVGFLRFAGQSLDGLESQQRRPGDAGPDHVLLTWKPSPLLDDWVRGGHGRLSVQGIGNDGSGTTTAVAVLKGASERLEVMSWGLAAKYRVVLKGMLAQFDA